MHMIIDCLVRLINSLRSCFYGLVQDKHKEQARAFMRDQGALFNLATVFAMAQRKCTQE